MTTTQTALPLYEDRHDALRASARKFVDTEIVPHVDDWERAGNIPRALFAKAGDEGLLGLKFGPEWGGTGPDYVAGAVWLDEVARPGFGSVGGALSSHSELAALYVDTEGTNDQKERYLRSSIAGTIVGALAITEPGAGSDVSMVSTRARRSNGGWRLTGEKIFITNGASCDYVVVVARTGEDPHRGLTLFVVDADTPGFTRNKLSMLGFRATQTGQLMFDDVALGEESVLGEVGGGFYALMKRLAWERIYMSICAVSAAEQSLRTAVAYASGREAPGRPTPYPEASRHRLAELATRVAQARAIVDHALRSFVGALEAGQELDKAGRRLVAQAKLYTQRVALDVADEAMQVHGAAGYTAAYPVERYWRDARLGPIGGGTDEIMREIIAGSL